jgi:hypothetical protein
MKLIYLLILSLVFLPQTVIGGCIEGDCDNGFGIRTYMSGCRYKGEWQNGKPDGQGTKSYPNGDIYQGRWQAGRRHGRGTTTNVDGRIFQETWQHGVLVSRTPVNGSKLKAVAAVKIKETKQAANDHPVQPPIKPMASAPQKKTAKITPFNPDPAQVAHIAPAAGPVHLASRHPAQAIISSPVKKQLIQEEKSTIVDPDGAVYQGKLLDNKPHGQGVLTFADGSIYNGEFKHDIREGKGTLTLANGEKYVGLFHNNLASGQGEYTFPDGRKYTGRFENDQFNGKGTLIFSDGTTYTGNFYNNLPEGSGVLSHPDGRKYIGHFHQGVFQGQGQFIFANGEKKTGIWQDGKYTGQQEMANDKQ